MFARSSPAPIYRSLHEVMTRWHELIKSACNPYRAELHYLRGPGPKWRAKQQNRAASDTL